MPVFLSRVHARSRCRWMALSALAFSLAVGSVSAAETPVVPESLVPAHQPLRQLWTFALEAPVVGMWLPPVELRDKLPYVIVLDADNNVTAFSMVVGADNRVVDTLATGGSTGIARRQNGTPAWRTQLGERVEGDPAFSDRGIYFSLTGSRLIGMDPRNGDVFWRLALPFPPSAGPVIREGGAEFEDEDADYVDADTRAQREAARGQRGNDLHVLLPGIDFGIHALGVDAQTIKLEDRYYPKNSVSLRKNTINTLWRHPTGTMVAGKPIEFNGAVYYTEKSGRPRGIRRERSGAMRVFGHEKMRMPATSGPVLADNMLLQSGMDGALYAFSTSEVEELWRRPLGGPLAEAPLLLPDHTGRQLAMVKVTGGPLVAVTTDAAKDRGGRQIWRFDDARAVVARLRDIEAPEDRRDLLLTLSDDGKSLAAVSVGPMNRKKSEKREILEKQLLKRLEKKYPEVGRILENLLDRAAWSAKTDRDINAALMTIKGLLENEEGLEDVRGLIATFLGGWEVWRVPLSTPVSRFVPQAGYPMGFFAEGRQIFAVALR